MLGTKRCSNPLLPPLGGAVADGLLDGCAGAASAATPGGAATDGREGLPAGRSVGEPGDVCCFGKNDGDSSKTTMRIWNIYIYNMQVGGFK